MRVEYPKQRIAESRPPTQEVQRARGILPFPEDQIVKDLFEGADQVELEKGDQMVAAILVGLARAMTDAQLIETEQALARAASEHKSFPYNFLRFARLLCHSPED